MTVDECILAYNKLAPKVFTKVHHRISIWTGETQGRFDHIALEREIKALLKKTPDARLREVEEDSCCKVFVTRFMSISSSGLSQTSWLTIPPLSIIVVSYVRQANRPAAQSFSPRIIALDVATMHYPRPKYGRRRAPRRPQRPSSIPLPLEARPLWTAQREPTTL